MLQPVGAGFRSFPGSETWLNEGDLVVHLEHGLGRFEGLVPLNPASAGEGLAIAYADGKVLVPAADAHLISRYGPASSAQRLDQLGAEGWLQRRAKAIIHIDRLGRRLIGLAAKRQLANAPEISCQSGSLRRFARGFPFKATADQNTAIGAVLKDLASGRPMDRLVCGDVGSGKTEVALRASFAAAMSKFQVAILVPTTVLARQHFETFQARFNGFPVRIALASSLNSASERTTLRSEVARGDIAIVIGTHALLSSNLHFANLGLIVIDEEHRFGVRHKERLKELREGVHVLTLSATPIPRTLQLAMGAVRELSLILTPPEGRHPVETLIVEARSPAIARALRSEKRRRGRSFYVCPRIADLAGIETALGHSAPELKIVQAHAKLPAGELDRVVQEFAKGAYDVLLSTTIVESGLDIPQANTMIVHDSDRLGLAQLYQLRGRVGRSSRQARCFLCLPRGANIAPTARQRLEILTKLDTVGAGFALAEQDMDLRGAGNLFGKEQSGYVTRLGIELFQAMLKRAILAAQNGSRMSAPWAPQLRLSVAAFIPTPYMEDQADRLRIYAKIALGEELARLTAELKDSHGPVPVPLRNLLRLSNLRGRCEALGLESIEAGPRGAAIRVRAHDEALRHQMIKTCMRRVSRAGLACRFDKRTGALIVRRQWPTDEDRLTGVCSLIGILEADGKNQEKRGKVCGHPARDGYAPRVFSRS